MPGAWAMLARRGHTRIANHTGEMSTLKGQQGLKEQKSKPDNPSESGDDIDRIAPFELRAERCRGERHTNGHGKSGPDQRPPS